MKIKYFLVLPFILFFLNSAFSFAVTQEIETVENGIFQIKNINLGSETVGTNLFSATIINRTNKPTNFVINLRSESIGLGRNNWQRHFFFRLQPKETKKIELEYEIVTPLIIRIILGFGESERYFDRDKWETLPREERMKKPPPKVNFFWERSFLNENLMESERILSNLICTHNVYLNKISAQKLSQIKSKLSSLIEKSRREENLLRSRLCKLFKIDRECPEKFDFGTETWSKKNPYWIWIFERNQMFVEVFSIAGEKENRIDAFFITSKRDAHEEKPLIFLLGGNPPGTKESLISSSIYFAHLGYHTVGIDRRPTARKLDKKEKFLTNFSDPVFDLLRLLNYIQSQSKYKVSKIGIYGFSAGASEGKFVAALDERIDAAVLGCGITSHNWMFKDRAWFPTYSGMIIFPELGLGHPDIANLTSEQFWENFNKVKTEHNQKAREIFNKVFPYFEDMDPLKVTSLIAPVPIMVITGAQDDQFRTSGVVEVDEAVQNAYKEFGLLPCSELYIQPRAGHTVNTKAGFVIAAFFERWLK